MDIEVVSSFTLRAAAKGRIGETHRGTLSDDILAMSYDHSNGVFTLSLLRNLYDYGRF
ncbi:hypothetical protein PSAC2689_150096 [Paraburkholderia sacchari]|uniref:hypothetical protein n=1 Tax=Paraburkholderia sacchari TaxID=159450 RepID=UPI0039A4EE30